jgi:murein DD-endopeptidase MepM/ murein hydrolase activator NlpD
LDHGQGVHSAYFHLDTVLVREGDLVARGASLARVGATGLATGPHLHYGIYLHGKDVDPATWHAVPSATLDPTAPRSAAPPR